MSEKLKPRNDMMTRQERELERQADVVTVRRGLPAGKWMKASDVYEFLTTQVDVIDLGTRVRSNTPITVDTNGVAYHRVGLIAIIIGVDILREMECEVPTLFISQK
jgi:hypothetical protein